MEHVTPDEKVGIDYARPIYIKQDSTRKPLQIADGLPAINASVVTSSSLDRKRNALTWALITVDHGSNFVGAT